MDDISVAQIGSPSSPILVLLREYEGHRFIDVRRYYVDRTTKETKPTKKGITLNARALAEIRDVFDRSEKAIADWFERDTSIEPEIVKRQMQERQGAAEKTARKAKPYNVIAEKWRSPTFFSCTSDGDNTNIALNDNHAFAKKLRRASGPKASDAHIRAAVGAMLAAYYHTKFLFDDLDEVKPAQFFDAFEYEWGIILSNYISAEK